MFSTVRPNESAQRARTIYRTFRWLALGVALSLFFVLYTPIPVHAGVFSAIRGLFSEKITTAITIESNGAQTTTLLQAAIHSDPNPSKGGGDIMVDRGALVAETGPSSLTGDMVLPTNGEISVYVVREGDSLSQIAEMFSVTANTILWANDIARTRAHLIKPGDSLIILPVSGVRYAIQKGDTLASVARTYAGRVDDIIAYNGLLSENDIHIGDSIVIPGGRIAEPPVSQKTIAKTYTSTQTGVPNKA
jgi:LysM repeat protein